MQALEDALEAALVPRQTPPLLNLAMRHAVFPGGARVRPRLLLASAKACGLPDPRLSVAAAAAVELLHCASLVHDDMPCFDDAGMRRGRLSVHRAFGEPLALLAGDALIVLAFQVLARAPGPHMPAVLGIVGEAVGTPLGIVAGQAWECEARVDVAAYHRAKTAALFGGAAMAGAASAGGDAEAWRPVGERLGEAYQVADDIGDALGDAASLGKPVGQDAAHGRPNAVRERGVTGAVAHLDALTEASVAAIPPCPGRDALAALIRAEATRLVPRPLPEGVA